MKNDKLVILIPSCGLTDSKAEKIIRSRVLFSQKKNVVLKRGYVEYNWPRLQDYYYQMERAGLLKVEYLEHSTMFVLTHSFRVAFTQEGMKYVLGEKERPKPVSESDTAFISYVQTNVIDFVKIESVREIPSNNSAEIRYLMKRSDFTPFWQCLTAKENPNRDTLQHATFGLIKTNNGWEPIRQ